ncbi:MAG: hypothetical protein R3F11_03265 [Verrucomicrobiales bacterium]
MTLPEALDVIADDSPDQLRLIAAAKMIAGVAVKPDSLIGFETLVRCVDHGGVAAEIAARSLHLTLGRRAADEVTPSDIIVDREYWVQYLDTVHHRETHGRMDREANT